VPSAPSSVDPSASEPLYLQLMQVLADEIAAGRLNPGQRLPSERRICETYGVSRVTARRALRALVDEGLVESSRGRGWFVSSGPVSEPPNMLLSFSAMGRARGLEPSSRLLQRSVRPATLDEADLLGVAPGAQIFELERLRLLDGHPVAIDRSRIPLARCPLLTEVDFTVASLYETLGSTGDAVPSFADYTAEAVAAPAEQAHLLELVEGGPVLSIRARTYDQAQRPLELGHMIYRGDRYRFRARLWERGGAGASPPLSAATVDPGRSRAALVGSRQV
jgi:DNA-binding GntR family transcriptional regulator